LRVCMGGKFVTQDCRSSQGTDGVCVKYPGPSCENVDCATPLRVNSACCDNHGCFSGLCFNNVCKVRSGDPCNSTSDCIAGQVCREVSPGSFVCALP